jgi:hypothetical protein
MAPFRYERAEVYFITETFTHICGQFWTTECVPQQVFPWEPHVHPLAPPTAKDLRTEIISSEAAEYNCELMFVRYSLRTVLQ